MTILHAATAWPERRRGVGSRLLEAVIGSAPEGSRVTAETDDSSLGFYIANGFQAISLGEKYAGVERFSVAYDLSEHEVRQAVSQSLSRQVDIRPWRAGEELVVDTVLGPEADELWVSQFHRLHGADQVWPELRRTLVAIAGGGAMIGCASVAVNVLHSGRLPCAVEVAPHARRRGVGSALLSAIDAARPGAEPLSTKIRATNSG